MRNGLGLAVAVAVAIIAPSSAQAADFIVNLTSPTSSLGGSSFGNSLTYSVTSGADTLQMRATAWSIDTTKTPDKVQNAALNVYSGGLGIQDRGETNTSPDHSIDNSSGWIDFVMLQFDKPVDLTSMNIGWYSGDADATIRWGDMGVAWDVSPALNGQSVSVLDALIDGQINSDVSSNFTGLRSLDIPTMSNTYIISARSPTNSGTDYFKVKTIGVSTAAVPEPATWMAMLVGFGAIGVAQRRRRRPVEAQAKLLQA